MFRHWSPEPVAGAVRPRNRACRWPRVVVPFLVVLAVVGPLPAQEPDGEGELRLPPDPPEAHLGFRPGEDYHVVDWDQATSYLEALARQSDRVRLDTIGRSTLDRPMVLATITDPANQASLAEIRAVQARLADPRRIADPAERAELIRNGRLVVLITTGIHPTEVGGPLAVLELAYRLASATDPTMLKVLRECVVLIVPSLNPDGVDMVADWYRASVGMPWEGSPPPFLYHHYAGHDNNRDWNAFTQVETRSVVERVYNEWHPQIVHDIHQQGPTGSRYFVPPWLDPIEPNVDPLLTAAANALGTAIAWELLRQGKMGVVVNASYDAWGPARAYAHYHAAVRLLSETASARMATPVDILPEELRATDGGWPAYPAWNQPVPWPGGRWDLADILDYMESGALALLKSAAGSREAWLDNFVTVGERAVAGWPEWPRAWVIPGGRYNEASMAELARILLLGQVEIQVAIGELRVGTSTFRTGSLVVDMRQPYAAFAQVLLAPQAYPGVPDGSRGPAREPYDVTAHNLPLLLGVEAEAVRGMPAGEMVRMDRPPVLSPPRAPGVSGEAGLLVGLYQPWVPVADEGWTRWLFDRHEIPYATVHDQQVRQGGLAHRFTSIVLPSIAETVLDEGWATGSMPVQYTGGLGAVGAQELRTFVEEGGTLVALGASSGWVIERLGLPVTDRLRGQAGDVFLAPGAQVQLHVDTTTTVGRSMPPQPAAWIEGGGAFDLPAGSAAVSIATYGARPRVLSGWVHGVSVLSSASAIVEVPIGRGRVVLFGIRPQYRGQSLATFPLLFNSLRARP